VNHINSRKEDMYDKGLSSFTLFLLVIFGHYFTQVADVFGGTEEVGTVRPKSMTTVV
jgi:hypothetical protein